MRSSLASSDTRQWLITAARRPASWAAVAAAAGGLLGAASVLPLILPRGFLAWGVSNFAPEWLRFLVRLAGWGDEIFRVLTVLSLGGVCLLLTESRFRFLPITAGVFSALLFTFALVSSVVMGSGLPTPLAMDAAAEPVAALRAMGLALAWGKPIALMLFGLVFLRVGWWRLTLLLILLGALELPLLWEPLLSLAQSLGNAEWPILLLGFPGMLPGLLGFACWALLGVVILLSDKERLDEKRKAATEENRRKARRLYEEAFGAGDLSVVDELVAEGFFDHRHNRRGRREFRRTIAGLRRTFPDLSVSIEEQTAEYDTVTTRCAFSGTDLGGVLWYPPTGKHATFSGVYVDRFSGGWLTEHRGETGTTRLLEQLGLPPSSTIG
ncbi:MAG: ester cyclase [Rubrobacteraceae bacterium]